MVCFYVVQNNNIFKQNQPVAHIYMDTWIDRINNKHWRCLITQKQRKVTNYYVVQILCANSGGSPFWSPSHRHGHQTMDQTTSFDQHWITAARGIIETLALDPMTGIFCPFISCLLHTKTGQHSLPPLPCIWLQELRQGLLNSANGVLLLIPIMVRMVPQPTRLHITHHLSPFTPCWEGCMIAKPWWDFPKSAEGALHTSP